MHALDLGTHGSWVAGPAGAQTQCRASSCWPAKHRYIHLPGSLNVATRVEAKRREAAEARKVHELLQGPLPARRKGDAAHPQGAAWGWEQEEESAEEGDEDMEM